MNARIDIPVQPLPSHGTWIDQLVHKIPPLIVDRDPGAEHPAIRVQFFSTFGGNARTCPVCLAINDRTILDKSRCRACQGPLDEQFVPVTFTRSEIEDAKRTWEAVAGMLWIDPIRRIP